MFLQTVPHSGDVGRHLIAVGQANTSHLAECRIRFFWGRSIHTSADPPFLRAPLQGRSACLLPAFTSPFFDQLINGRHFTTSSPDRHCSQGLYPLCLQGYKKLHHTSFLQAKNLSNISDPFRICQEVFQLFQGKNDFTPGEAPRYRPAFNVCNTVMIWPPLPGSPDDRPPPPRNPLPIPPVDRL